MSKHPRHRAGDPPNEVPVEAPAAQFDFLAAPAAPVETPTAGAPTDNVAIVSGLFGETDSVSEPARRDEPVGSLGELVQPMQTWPPAAAAPVEFPAQVWPPADASPLAAPDPAPTQTWPAAPVQDPAQAWPEAAPAQAWPQAVAAPDEEPQAPRGRRAASYTDENAVRG